MPSTSPSGSSQPSSAISWRRMVTQILVASALAWIVVGGVFLAGVTLANRSAGSAFGIALLVAIAGAAIVGIVGILRREPPVVDHAFDWLLRPERSDSLAREQDADEANGLTPLGVALVVVIEMVAVLVTSNV
jgi:hypothetical protein